MTDVLDEYVRNLPPDPYGEHRTALCVEHYRNLAGKVPNPFNRPMEMFPMTVHQVKVAAPVTALTRERPVELVTPKDHPAISFELVLE